LNIFKTLFKQLIECKIQRQLTDIENRKRIFMDTFAMGIHRKMTNAANALGHEVSLSNAAIGKFGHSADFAARKKASSADNNDNEMCVDDAMSVDGDISYCSNEMEELQSIQPLKYKESNSSLHLVEKKETAVYTRMFISDTAVTGAGD